VDSSIILLDLPTGNIITDFASERDAWDALLSWARDDGLEAIAGLSLLRVQDGDPTLIAMEGDLVRRVAVELQDVDSRDHGKRSHTVRRVAS
jgi:hypothetical protein